MKRESERAGSIKITLSDTVHHSDIKAAASLQDDEIRAHDSIY